MMEFEDEHEEEEEEDEDEEDEEITITPTSFKPSPALANDKKPPTPIAACRYRDCLKNHAVGLGGHAVDGCGEFMPAGPDGTLDALKCAACNCHRNFHRKELLLDSPTTTSSHHHQLALYTTPRPHQQFHPHPHPHPHSHPHPPAQQQVYQFYPYNRTSAASPSPTSYLHVSPRPLALPSPTGGGPQSTGSEPAEDVLMGGTTSSRKKRHRTKFSQEQKEKMVELAEQVGWRIQKQDEALVQNFCNESGVKRHVLKVWMHNNKHTLGKKP